jgi:hypothetical protein
MKELKEHPLIYFLAVLVLVFLHTYIFKMDIGTWILCNFYLSAILLVFLISKGVYSWKKQKEKV